MYVCVYIYIYIFIYETKKLLELEYTILYYNILRYIFYIL